MRWDCEVSKIKRNSYIKNEDVLFLYNLGKILKNIDQTNAEKLFYGLKNELNLLIENSISEEKEKGKLYKSLGVLFGIFVSVILV